MPKKKAVVDLPVSLNVTRTRRAASKEALKQLQKLTEESAAYDSPETLEIVSDEDEVMAIDVAPRKKYRASHRKSSDGNDRDLLIIKSVNCNEETLKLDAWVEELSPEQLSYHNRNKKEMDDLNNALQKLLKDTPSDAIFEGSNSALYELEHQVTNNVADVTVQPPQKTNSGIQLVMDPSSGVVVGTVTPANNATQVAQPQTRKRTRAAANLFPSSNPPVKMFKPSSPVAKQTPAVPQTQVKPTESTALGGLSHGNKKQAAPVVDLTDDDGRNVADSREISFNKLQGKTFPSLVVVARPHLKMKDSNGSERSKLDVKVKSVLMHPATKFTEWLIQQGLIRSEQVCTTHTHAKLKLGMYSDVSRFPFSGGYVWISDCCPLKFVSVFSGSLFEASPHPPSIILKLMYHWSCQTNVQNVIQWVKVDNLYMKGMYTLFRAICTVALHTHLDLLGGPGKRVEVGVISLGTTSQDGQQRQVKVEVLGLLETEAKSIRLRAVDPITDGDRNYKKRFSKILEPLTNWVNMDSVIVTDMTVDKSTLHSMGFKNVVQNASTNNGINNSTIMEYLRKIVPRMFQNTLSLLSRQIIQQFLDELVWREWYGSTAMSTFDNIIVHLAEQTRIDSGQSLIMRLNKVSSNPFKNWSVKQYLKSQHTSKSINDTTTNRRQIRAKKGITSRSESPNSDDLDRPSKSVSPDIPEQMVPIEHYYYGTIDGTKKCDNKFILNVKCTICKTHFTNNVKLMIHLFTHAHNVSDGVHQCCYCLATMISKEVLDKHISSSHPSETRCDSQFVCIICEQRFQNTYNLGKHMSKEHVPSELPYRCATCGYRCSSHKQVVDHFIANHDGGATMQCPFCLKVMHVATCGRMLPQNISYFLQHLQKHHKKALPKKCTKCALWFIQKEVMKDHVLNMHVTQRRKAGLIPWTVPRFTIMVPVSRQDEPIEEEDVDISNLEINVASDLKCRECSHNLTDTNHFPSILYCTNNNCQYSTCCKHTMEKHAEDCKSFASILPMLQLPFRMHCVCGFSESEGNLMAKHLAVCERKSAYPSENAAKAATVTHSMLDVLGLVRRPEEPVTTLNEVMEIDVDESPSKSDKEDDKLTEEPGSAKDIITVEINENSSDSKDAAGEENEIEDDDVVVSVEPSDTNDTTKEGGKQDQCEELLETDKDSVMKELENEDVIEKDSEENAIISSGRVEEMNKGEEKLENANVQLEEIDDGSVQCKQLNKVVQDSEEQFPSISELQKEMHIDRDSHKSSSCETIAETEKNENADEVNISCDSQVDSHTSSQDVDILDREVNLLINSELDLPNKTSEVNLSNQTEGVPEQEQADTSMDNENLEDVVFEKLCHSAVDVVRTDTVPPESLTDREETMDVDEN